MWYNLAKRERPELTEKERGRNYEENFNHQAGSTAHRRTYGVQDPANVQDRTAQVLQGWQQVPHRRRGLVRNGIRQDSQTRIEMNERKTYKVAEIALLVRNERKQTAPAIIYSIERCG